MGQYGIQDSAKHGVLFHADFGYNLPGGHLVHRFGSSLGIGGGILIKPWDNWFINPVFHYHFGAQVKEDDILDGLMTSNNFLIGSFGSAADPVFQERAYQVAVRLGYLVPKTGPNPNSGVLVMAGFGFFQHKIRIEYLENDIDNKVPSLEGDYRKGYDRLTNGASLNQFIGYMHSGNQRLINFYVGFEFLQAFTENRREINFDTGVHDGTQRLDLMFGIKAGWFFPVYKANAQEVFFD
jgi:hypothetical protein